MKIVIISNLYPPFVRGGAEMVVNTIAEGLQKNLHRVSVITTRPYEGLGSLRPVMQQTNGVDVYRFFPLNIYHYLQDFRYSAIVRLIWHLLDIFNLHSYFVVGKILRQQKPDVVLTHNLMGIGFLLPRLIKRLGIKHVHTIHDVQLYNPSGLIIKGHELNWTQRIVNGLGYFRLMRWLFARADIIVSPSQFLQTFYEKYGFFTQGQKFVLRNPTDQDFGQLTRSESADLRLVFLGQVTQAKGIIKLIEVIKDSSAVNIRLRIIGLGPDLKQALDLAKGDERISFFGWRTRNEILDVLSQSDILIMPSICYENSPTVIVEALSLGLPVITADIGGAGELITADYNGWKFEAGNWRQLAELLNNLLRKKTDLENMSDNCRASVADLTTAAYVNKLVRIISEQ